MKLTSGTKLHIGQIYKTKVGKKTIPLYSVCLKRRKKAHELFWIDSQYVDAKEQQTTPKEKSQSQTNQEPEVATYDEKLTQILKSKPGSTDYKIIVAWENRLRNFMDRVPKRNANKLSARLSPVSTDELGKYFRIQVTDENFRQELIDRLNKVDIALNQLVHGEFGKVIRQLNPMWMKLMLKRIQGFDTTYIEKLMENVDDGKLDERGKFRVLAALGAVYITRTGIDTDKLDVLDGYMKSAVLPEQQRVEIREVLPMLPGGGGDPYQQNF